MKNKSVSQLLAGLLCASGLVAFGNAAYADAINAAATASATATTPTIPAAGVVTYAVTDNGGAPVGNFTYNPTSGVWAPDTATAAAGWSQEYSGTQLTPVPGAFVLNAGTPNQQNVNLDSAPAPAPVLTLGAATTTALSGTSYTTPIVSSVLGAGSTVAGAVAVTAPGTSTMTGSPNPINYTYLDVAAPANNITTQGKRIKTPPQI
jgi:hypothetical protein